MTLPAHLSNEDQLLPPVANLGVSAEVSPDLFTSSIILRPLFLSTQQQQQQQQQLSRLHAHVCCAAHHPFSGSKSTR
jgi:hypothetical protein